MNAIRRMVARRLAVGLAGAASALPAHAAAPARPAQSAAADTADPGSIRVEFAESTEPIPNPDCGLAGWADIPLRGDSGFLRSDGVPRALASGNRVLRMQVDLSEFVGRDRLDDFVAHRLEDSLLVLRASGMKVILRFQYGSPAEADYRKSADAPLPRVLGHIRQLGPAVHALRDGISFIEAGFVGAWGEWHTSSNDLTRPAAAAAIRDALLEHFPADRRLLLRQPRLLRQWSDAPVAERSRALKTMRPLHLGMHNDSILSLGPSNGNTWLSQDDRRWVEQASEWIVYGGEVAAGGLTATRADEVEGELRRLHQCWINGLGQFGVVEALLRREGRRDAVVSRIGYRLVLQSLEMPMSLSRGKPFDLSLRWRNDGFARVPYSREAQLLLIRQPDANVALSSRPHAPQGLQTVAVPLSGSDPRQLAPQSARFTTLQTTLKLPSQVSAGVYEPALRLPDPAPALTEDPLFTLRPAVRDGEHQRWDQSTGSLRLGRLVRVG